jgi:predicted transcriptional regulator
MLIGEIYHKGAKTITVDTPIKEALKQLLEDKINGLIVTDSQDQIKGVISLQDIAGATVPDEFKRNVAMASAMYRRGFFKENCLKIVNWPVSKIMRRDFLKVDLNTNIMAVTVDFLKNDLYIVPVVENGKLIGVITRSEIKKAMADEMGIIKTNSED